MSVSVVFLLQESPVRMERNTFGISNGNIQFMNNSYLIPEQPVLHFHKGENPMRPETIDWNSIPDTISKDQFCKICHMSKRTATKYLGAVIPCSDNGKKTHRYTITKAELMSFLERYPERHNISVLPPVCRYSKTAFSTAPLSESVTTFMHGYYSQLLHSEKEILRVMDICRITGYGETTVNTWFNSGDLCYVVIRGAKHTAKEALIDFLSSDGFDKIFRKSDWHLKQIETLRRRIT